MNERSGRRVLMLLENNPYPQDRRVYGEARALIDAGYHVTVICPAVGQRLRETREGVQVYRYPAPPDANSFMGYLWEYGYSMLATFIISLFVSLRQGFDIVHTANPPDTLVFIAAFYKLFGKRFVYDHHDLAPEMYYARFGGKGNPSVQRALAWLERLSCRLADQVIATNQSYKSVEMRRDGVPEERITIVRNGPDLSRIRPQSPDPRLRRPGKTIIGYVGEMGFHDGVDCLLRALQHLVHKMGRDDVYCLLVGSGDAEPSLRSLAEQLGLAGHVLFTGWVEHEQVAQYLSSFDICAAPEPSNPYNDRSTMIKMMEYMAAGKPIVAFDLPEHRFTAQAAALYVGGNDEAEFARGLAQLMDDPERRQAMGAAGRQRVKAELAWCHSVPNLVQVYHRLSAEAPQAKLPT